MELLQVRKSQIVDGQGRPIRLRGVNIGGWMNMENFINGFPGVEHGIRAEMAEVLGPGKAQFLFDRWLDTFLAEEDIAFIKSCGMNAVRLPFNYRHFERDAEPFRHVESGFERLDRVVRWCEKRGVYVILDFHAAQGWQNPDWHSDNANGPTLLWQHPHFQDRFVALWEELARRYKGNPTIAGYDLLNEPTTCRPGPWRNSFVPNWDALNQLYRRTVTAIRAIDPDHIIFLEGDCWATLFYGLDAPFADNLAYSAHSYRPPNFGPGLYPGEINGEHWDKQALKKSCLRQQSFAFAAEHNVPLWIGEFGSVYNGPQHDRPDRVRALDDQIDVYEEAGAHWTFWTYKDLGVMGMVTVNSESEYLQLVSPVLDAKQALNTDAWMTWAPDGPARSQLAAVSRSIERVIGDPEIDPKANEDFLARAALAGYAATVLEPAYAKRFKGMSEMDIDRVMQSFALKNCRPHQELIDLAYKHSSTQSGHS